MHRINPVGIGLAIAGAGAAIVSIFLPLLQATGAFAYVQSNSLVQNDIGLGVSARIVALSVGVLGATYRYHRRGKAGWGVALIGVVLLVGSIVDGHNSSLTTLYSLDSSGNAVADGISATAKLGIALYVTGVGGALAALGGMMMWRKSELVEQTASQPVPAPSPATKTCPDCAESVLAAANVCKHCGLRFDEAVAVS